VGTAINRGLAGVYFDESEICFIDGDKGKLIYRGYPIEELANKATYEEVVHLLWHGELPTQAQLDDLRCALNSNYEVPPAALEVLREFSPHTNPMHAIRSAVSLLSAFDNDPDDVSAENIRRIGTKLTAQVVTLTAAIQRMRNGKKHISARSDLGVAANFLYMLTGNLPSEAATRVMDVALVLHAEHSSNASTFTARTTASTLTDVYSAITAALGSLKGPLHGGANTAVMNTFEGIGRVEDVEQFVLKTLSDPKGRMMGFGHRVYTTLDPRAGVLRDVAKRLAEESGEAKWFEMNLEMERVMDREMAKLGKKVKPNVDFFSASVYRMLGLPPDMYTPIFALARIPGWMAHLYEQYSDNRLMRPRLSYKGEKERKFVPIEAR
jgi:citrate synthase